LFPIVLHVPVSRSLNTLSVYSSLMRFRISLLLLAIGLIFAHQPTWVSKSNENAQILLNIEARYAPEGAGKLGVSGLDEQISIPSADKGKHFRQDAAASVKVLRSRLAAEQGS